MRHTAAGTVARDSAALTRPLFFSRFGARHAVALAKADAKRESRRVCSHAARPPSHRFGVASRAAATDASFAVIANGAPLSSKSWNEARFQRWRFGMTEHLGRCPRLK
jgi:hypothetical protein